MNILVVNDDGYLTEGIKILAEAYRNYGDVYVVAPHIGQSGASSSITVGGGLVVHEQGENIWSIEGTPSDCVKFALYGLKLDVDLVVSGINYGYNLGIDTIYSGTIGATMEAMLHGKQAIAYSSEYTSYDVAKQEIDNVIQYIFNNDLLSTEYILNVNFPRNHFKKSKGIKITGLELKRFNIEYTEDNKTHISTRTFHPGEPKEGTDVWATKNGYTSITPLKLGNEDAVNRKKIHKKVHEKSS